MVNSPGGWQFDPDINTAFIETSQGSAPAPDPGYEDFQGGRPQGVS
jgi:hypothetical protein